MKPGGPVLLVEDDLDIAEAILDVLMDEGYEVAHATNGREALELLHSQPAPAVILLDLMMPEMDGPEFRAEQLSDARYAKIPVVVLSADRLIAEKAHALGVWGFVVKPLQPEQLLSIIERSTQGVEA
ncbi:MAG: response regulator [Myxococcaceae bacterium]|nr:response regulator [Myxococcaceae bacterium]